MNQFIEEDFERVLQLESIYVSEHKMQIEEEYWEYEERQNKLPALITLNVSSKEAVNIQLEENEL